jgi:hypothetical protein
MLKKERTGTTAKGAMPKRFKGNGSSFFPGPRKWSGARARH